MQLQELKSLLALEPTWTVSINGREFVQLSNSEIEFNGEIVRIGRQKHRVLQLDWLRSNIMRLRTRNKRDSRGNVLTFFPGNQLPGGIDLRRRRRLFQTRLAHALAAFYKVRVPVREILHSDKQRGIGGAYPRFVFGNRAVISVDPEEDVPVLDGIMRAALLWSEFIPHRICVVVPSQRKQTTVSRLKDMTMVRSRFEWMEWDGSSIVPLDMEIPVPETHVHEFHLPPVEIEVSRICALAPDLLQAVPNIPARAISIRLRGLEVARVSESETTYPMGEPLQPLIESLARHRQAGSRHPMARAYEERWLESNLIRQIQELLPVCPGWIYPQVPSFTGAERNIIDLLTVTREGRLVVIEVKASADPDLPFQALDYWQAVERHRQAGDFQNRGYFSGMSIQEIPALLVVVAPLLSFHKTFDRLVAALPGDLSFLQIGISQSWKRKIKILRRRGALS